MVSSSIRLVSSYSVAALIGVAARWKWGYGLRYLSLVAFVEPCSELTLAYFYLLGWFFNLCTEILSGLRIHPVFDNSEIIKAFALLAID